MNQVKKCVLGCGEEGVGEQGLKVSKAMQVVWPLGRKFIKDLFKYICIYILILT